MSKDRIWPFEVPNSCATCGVETDSDDLWRLFDSKDHTLEDLVCIECIPASVWESWERYGRQTAADNILSWLLTGDSDAARHAEELIQECREEDEAKVLRERLVAYRMKTHPSAAEFTQKTQLEKICRNRIAGGYRTWNLERLRAEVAVLRVAIREALPALEQ